MAASTKLAMITRTMCSAAGATVKAPIQLFNLEGRYATALYSAATKLKQLDQAEKELVEIQRAIATNKLLHDVIVSPIINRKILETTFREIGAQAKLSTTTTNLLILLAENGRLKKLNGVVNSFRQIMSAHRGEVVCEVITAKPLEAAQRKQLEDVLRKFIKSNETIHLKTDVDPALLGGLVVSIGDKYVDMSVATKVKRYTDLISTVA